MQGSGKRVRNLLYYRPMTTYHYTITAQDSFPLLQLQLQQGQAIKAKWNALTAMGPGIQLTGKMDGGLLKALWRGFSSESFFLQNYVAEKDSWVWLSQEVPGSIMPLQLESGESWLVNKGGFLAGTSHVDVSTKVQSLGRSLFSGEGMFVVKISGPGLAFLGSFGAMVPLTIPAGETAVVEFGRLVAWPENMKYDITIPAKGLWSAFTTGQILGCKFTGPGTVYLQTLSGVNFANWLSYLVAPFLKRSA